MRFRLVLAGEDVLTYTAKLRFAKKSKKIEVTWNFGTTGNGLKIAHNRRNLCCAILSINNSDMYVIPKWLQTPYGYGESSNAKYFFSLPLSIRGLPIWLRGLCFWPSI